MHQITVQDSIFIEFFILGISGMELTLSLEGWDFFDRGISYGQVQHNTIGFYALDLYINH